MPCTVVPAILQLSLGIFCLNESALAFSQIRLILWDQSQHLIGSYIQRTDEFWFIACYCYWFLIASLGILVIIFRLISPIHIVKINLVLHDSLNW